MRIWPALNSSINKGNILNRFLHSKYNNREKPRFPETRELKNCMIFENIWNIVKLETNIFLLATRLKTDFFVWNIYRFSLYFRQRILFSIIHSFSFQEIIIPLFLLKRNNNVIVSTSRSLVLKFSLLNSQQFIITIDTRHTRCFMF